MTEWKEIIGWPGYWINRLGQVRSRKRDRLKWALSQKGYPYVTLYRDDKPKKRPVHQLMLETFVGPRPTGMVGCHNDGNPLNAQIGNLRWDTQSNNLKDRNIHGTSYQGVGHPQAILNDTSVTELRQRHSQGERIASLAREYEVSEGCVRNIVKGRTWQHLLDSPPQLR